MIKKWFRFFSARPVAFLLVALALLGASYAVIHVLSFIIPMSLGLLVATIVTFPIISALILALIAAVSIILTTLNKKCSTTG